MIASAATANVMGPCVPWTHARLNRFVPTVVSYVVRCSPARGLHHLPRPAPVRIHANGPRVGVEGVVPTRSVSHPRPCRVTSCLCHAGSRPRVLTVNCRALAAAGALVAGVVIAGLRVGKQQPRHHSTARFLGTPGVTGDHRCPLRPDDRRGDNERRHLPVVGTSQCCARRFLPRPDVHPDCRRRARLPLHGQCRQRGRHGLRAPVPSGVCRAGRARSRGTCDAQHPGRGRRSVRNDHGRPLRGQHLFEQQSDPRGGTSPWPLGPRRSIGPGRAGRQLTTGPSDSVVEAI